MAKVTGPLFSIGARGKLGQAIVYSFWKGTNVVREWLKPANPKSGNQGDRRVMLGGLGRAPKYVQKDKTFEGFAKAIAPSGQSWISYFVKYIMKTYFPDVNGFDVRYAVYVEHTANSNFIDEAVALGLTNFNLPYQSMASEFSQGFMLYCLALYATDQYLLDNTKFNDTPYSKALKDWELADIQEMVADFSA